MQLDSFFRPKNIAVIGASRTKWKLGYELYANLKKYKGGKVYAVNPHMKYKKITDIDEPIDLAAIIVKAELVPQVVKECGIKGVKCAVIFAGGFKEAGRADLQNEILEYAKLYHVRIIGPNVNGIYAPHSGLDCMYMLKDKMARPKAGPVSLITQSGTIGIWFLEWMAANRFGVSKHISLGNRCDVKEDELIDYLNKDPETKIIAVYIEGGIDGGKIYEVIERCKKPLIILKCGKEWNEKGNKVVYNHIGCNIGNYQSYVWKTCSRFGAIMVSTIEEFFAAIKALVMQPRVNGNKVMVVTNGAGPFAMLSNTSDIEGFEDLNLEIYDLIGTSTVKEYSDKLKFFEKNADLSVVYINLVIWNSIEEGKMIKALSSFKKPIICSLHGNPHVNSISRRVEKMGMPVFNTPQEMAAAVVALCK